MSDVDKAHLLNLTTQIVSAYVGHNSVAAGDLPDLFDSIFARVEQASKSADDKAAKRVLNPAVPIADSVTDTAIICLEDGQSFRSLKRHLRTKYDLTPEAYREKWGLPVDYPMVAPEYARERSKLAKRSGLGRKSSA